MRHVYLLVFAVASALMFASAAQAGPMNGAAALGAVASQASPDTVTQVGWDDRRYSRSRSSSVRVSSNFRRTVDHGWHTGSFSRRAYPQQSCL